METTDTIQGQIEQLNRDHLKAVSFPLSLLEKIVRHSEVQYYNSTGEPSIILDDQVYDYLKELIQTKRKDVDISISMSDQDLTGMEHVPSLPTRRMVALPIWMGSTTKINHGTGQLETWVKSYVGPYLISAKMDGASALYLRKDGVLKLYSRGKGSEGQDISELLQYMEMPELKDGEMARGELILKKTVFEAKYKRNVTEETDKFCNSRNAVSGMVNKIGANAAKGISTLLDGLASSFIRDIEFVAYELITSPSFSASQQFSKLDIMFGPRVARHQLLSQISDDTLSELYDRYRKEMDYEIDGLVVCNDSVYDRPWGKNPDYNRAYKKPLDILTAITKVIDVEWSISKDGLLKPVVIVEPISLDGVTIRRATGYNAKFIVDSKIGPTAQVEIVRSGGVIPKIIRVVTAADDPKLPTQECFWNETAVDLYVKYTSNDQFSPEKRTMNVKRLHHFLKKIETKGIGEKVVGRLYDGGIRTIPALLTITVTDINFIGGKLASNIVETIMESRKNLTLPVLAGASMIFGRLMGVTRFESIFRRYPNLMESFEVINDDVEALTSLFQDIDGFAEKTARQAAKGFSEFVTFISELKSAGIEPVTPVSSYEGENSALPIVFNDPLPFEPISFEPITFNPISSEQNNLFSTIHTPAHIQNTPSYTSKNSLVGKTVLLTGFRDPKITGFITSNGGKAVKTLTKAVNLLLIKNAGISNNKTQIAQQRGIEVKTLDDFVLEYM